VHTPDGAPCGLINHLTAVCKVRNDLLSLHDYKESIPSPTGPGQLVTHQSDTRKMASLLVSLGVSPISQSILFPSDQYLDVFLDGMAFCVGKPAFDLIHYDPQVSCWVLSNTLLRISWSTDCVTSNLRSLSKSRQCLRSAWSQQVPASSTLVSSFGAPAPV